MKQKNYVTFIKIAERILDLITKLVNVAFKESSENIDFKNNPTTITFMHKLYKKALRRK